MRCKLFGFACYLLISQTLASNQLNNLSILQNIFPCVPVMGTGVVADPMNFVPRLAQSIDFCVHNFVLVKGKGINLTEGINILQSSPHIRNLTIITYDYGLFSVSEGWNLILKSFPNDFWYLICAYDVEFKENQLEAISNNFWRDSGYKKINDVIKRIPIELHFAFLNWENMEAAGYNLFAISSLVIRAIGYFDENIFPAFYEDNDWNIRCLRWGEIKWGTYMDIKIWHGEHDTLQTQNITTSSRNNNNNNNNKTKNSIHIKKYVSGTIYLKKSIPLWQTLKNHAIPLNTKYLVRKWGCNHVNNITHNGCNFIHPFNNSSNSLSYWEKDHRRINHMLKISGFPLRNISHHFNKN